MTIEQVVVFEKSTGKVVSSVATQLPETLATDALGVLVGVQANPGRSYVQDGVIIDIPIQPSVHHIFDWRSKQWFDQRTSATQWVEVKTQRNKLLAACDWTQLPDVAWTTAEAWAGYRQALRDITTQADPFNIVWPTAPG